VYFGPPQITWSNLENTHPPIWLPVFIQRDSLGGAVGGGIPIRCSSVKIISSWYCYFLLKMHYKIGSPKTAHNIILLVDRIWSRNRDSLPGGKQIYIKNMFTSKVAYHLKFLPTFLGSITSGWVGNTGLITQLAQWKNNLIDINVQKNVTWINIG